MPALIIKNDGMGDLILSSGAIARIAGHFKGGADLVTCEANLQIAKMIPGVRRILPVSRDQLRFVPGTTLPWGSAQDIKTLREVVESDYDSVICLRRFIRRSSLVVMSCCSHIPDRHCMWQMPTNISVEEAGRHSKGFRHFTGPLEVPNELAYYKLFLKDAFGIEDACKPLLCLDGKAAKERGLLGFGISGASSRWPYEHWANLGRTLAAEGWKIILLGGPGEATLAAKLSTGFPCINMAGLLNYEETAEVMRRMTAFIGNDTGLTHFASLLVDPVVVIQGGGTFRRFFPWPDSTNQYLLFHGIDCFDCDWICKHKTRQCLRLVAPEDVAAYLHDIIAGKAERTRNLGDGKSYTLSWRHPRLETAQGAKQMKMEIG